MSGTENESKNGRKGLRGEIVVFVSVKVQFYMGKRDAISGGFGEEWKARFERTFFHTRYVRSRYIFIPKSVLADSLLLHPALTVIEEGKQGEEKKTHSAGRGT